MRSNCDCLMLKTQRKVIFRMPAARTSMYVCLFVIFFRSRELALRKNAPIRSPGLLILVLKIYAILGNFFRSRLLLQKSTDWNVSLRKTFVLERT
jgi:hypothetical protein